MKGEGTSKIVTNSWVLGKRFVLFDPRRHPLSSVDGDFYSWCVVDGSFVRFGVWYPCFGIEDL